MDVFEFIRFMEEKKEERKEDAKKYKQRDIVERLKNEKGELAFIYYGLRGIGKSVSLNQAMAERDGMFIDGSSLSYYKLDIVKVVKDYIKHTNLRTLYIDELTDISEWDKKLKIIYDNFKLKIIATGSSAIKIRLKGSAMARRAVFYELPPLTFREYLRIKKGIHVNESAIDIFSSMPKDAYTKAKDYLLRLRSLSYEFREYLTHGFPLAFGMNVRDVAYSLLSQIVTFDFPYIGGFNIDAGEKARKIVETIALSPPEKISLQRFAEIAGTSRTTVLNILNALETSSFLISVLPYPPSSASLRKERKFLFSSPLLRHSLTLNLYLRENIGGLREDAVVSSFYYKKIPLFYNHGKKQPDYKIRAGNAFLDLEIGGPSKTKSQIRKGFLLKEGEEISIEGNVVTLPLYLACLV